LQKTHQQILFSASDLTHFADCSHRTWLDRLHLDSPMDKAVDDEQAKLVQQKGYQHEAAYFARLQREFECIEIDVKLTLAGRAAATRDAIRDGVQVIYQATLERGNLIGHADFLLRGDAQGPDGRWQYEVADTKLAHSSKAKFILQLCFYSDLLSDLTGQLPRQMHVELGNGKRESFLVADYIFYYRQLQQRQHAFVATYPAGAPPYPAPCDHCPLCPWRDRCDARRAQDDHLSAVASITRQQIGKFEQAGIATMAALAGIADDASIPKMANETLARLHQQAALQVFERESGQQKVVVLPMQEGEIRSFARLPQPDAGDLFFDMEGNPMQEGGLEYLFGLYFFDDGEQVFKPFWAHDRHDERIAFMAFIDFVMARRAQFPGMHVYHYAHYENTALKRLMTLHGIRESSVDQLLREHRLVDLYKVVREGLRLSKPNYSIKSVEAFYTEKRSGDVQKALDSIVMYERWRESGDAVLLESIRSYNEDDCRSTWQLREWLLSMRPSTLAWHVASGPDGAPVVAPKSDKTRRHEETLEQFHQRLIVQPKNPALAPELAALVDSVLDFYRRAAKPAWWSLFDRQDATFEDLLEEPEVIAGLHSPVFKDSGARNNVFRYRYPAQDLKLKAGTRANQLDNLKEVLVIDIDEDNGTADLEVRADKSGEPPSTMSISSGAPVDSAAMQAALFVFAESILRAENRFRCVQDFLMRAIPRIGGIASGMPIIDAARDPLPQVIAAVTAMQDSCLFIQGPPGTGKTYTGSHLIAQLLLDGKRVAVSSNSHKAINNLLSAVDKRMHELGASYFGLKKVSSDEQCIDSDFIFNVVSNAAITRAQPQPQLLAGTAWLLARSDFTETFDYLFIDEAGQVSLANTIAMGMCAKNLILLGDQMQLGQPIQGAHPGRSGESALDYLLNGVPTIAPDRGVFLGATFRMHPDVCQFISNAIYDSRLVSDPSTLAQALVLDVSAHTALKPTGIRYLPVEHDGCSQRSEEEAVVVRELVQNLLTQRYRDGKGIVRPMTLEDILIVAPYNMQVNLLKRMLPPNARVGTVDKFQGQEAQVVIISMTTSSEEYLPRYIDFLYSKNRLNVAISRARCFSLLVANPRLKFIKAVTPLNMSMVNTLCKID
jgi:predicted RecB family nuclease